MAQGSDAVSVIRLPRTSSRRQQSFAKLLFYVDPDAECGFGFEGKILRPGQFVSPDDLWGDPRYPRSPVLLEYAGAEGQGRGIIAPNASMCCGAMTG